MAINKEHGAYQLRFSGRKMRDKVRAYRRQEGQDQKRQLVDAIKLR